LQFIFVWEWITIVGNNNLIVKQIQSQKHFLVLAGEYTICVELAKII
jgi:hypothetical protein